ncbi:damage response protein 1 [Aspergillus awamori]|uniref:Damage response protein 1 n=1 Tax=Aspergillus awamori TaxID=105351 RepID=A0A401L0T8_ASPAW|nr:damage response protein 1 [Aspergillus awamori]
MSTPDEAVPPPAEVSVLTTLTYSPTNNKTTSNEPNTVTNHIQRMTIATPINLILLSLFVILVYLQLRPKAPVSLPKGPPPVVFRTFTPTTLLPFNGENDAPVYLAVRGRVFDVTPGKNFYGPGGPYENFAGRDASRGLACQSFDEEMLTKDLKGPLDDLKDLDNEQLENLQSWEERFSEKYLVVGKLVAEGDPEAENS